MTITEFTDTFLPHLTSLYVEGSLPLHGLVDVDLWRQVFPEQGAAGSKQFHWYEVGLTCNPLQDQTLLLTYTLPQPIVKGHPKFVAIRIDPQARDARRAVIYTLRKPASIYDQWDIYYLPFPNQNSRQEQKFRIKIEGTDSLRNFVFSVQQISFSDSEYDNTWIGRIKDMIAGAVTSQ